MKKKPEIKIIEEAYKELYKMFNDANLTWSIQGLCEGISKAYTEWKLKKINRKSNEKD